MAFSKKTWKDRVSEYPNRRIINDGITTKTVTVGRDEGNVSEAGDAFNAENMNDLEERIYQATRNGGGGGGGTTDYDDLDNKPQINGVTLSGNKTTGDLDIRLSELADSGFRYVGANDLLGFDMTLRKWTPFSKSIYAGIVGNCVMQNTFHTEAQSIIDAINELADRPTGGGLNTNVFTITSTSYT